MKVKEWFKLFFSGAAMGVANSIPGVSGGTIAVILKIYQRMVDAIGNLFKQFLKSLVVLLPIGLGIIAAMIPCFFLFEKALDYFAFGIIALFAGLIIGSFPGITDEVKGVKITPIYIIICVASCLFAITLGVLSVVLKLDVSQFLEKPEWWFYIIVLLVGIIGSISLIIPGISGSMMMVVLGFYEPMVDTTTATLRSIFHWDLIFWKNASILGAFAIGMIIGFLSVAKLMSFLLKKYHNATFFGIIGFILGSTVTLFINNKIWVYYQTWSEYVPMWLELLLGGILLIAGAIGTYMLIRYYRKHKEQNDELTQDNIQKTEENSEKDATE